MVQQLLFVGHIRNYHKRILNLVSNSGNNSSVCIILVLIFLEIFNIRYGNQLLVSILLICLHAVALEIAAVFILLSDILWLVQDTFFISQVKDFYEDHIVKQISPDEEQRGRLDSSLEVGIQNLQEELSSTFSLISDELISLCSVQLKQVCDIPRLYRRTNREVITMN